MLNLQDAQVYASSTAEGCSPRHAIDMDYSQTGPTCFHSQPDVLDANGYAWYVIDLGSPVQNITEIRIAINPESPFKTSESRARIHLYIHVRGMFRNFFTMTCPCLCHTQSWYCLNKHAFGVNGIGCVTNMPLVKLHIYFLTICPVIGRRTQAVLACFRKYLLDCSYIAPVNYISCQTVIHENVSYLLWWRMALVILARN